MIDHSKFKDRKELFKFLVDNKEQLIAQKKYEVKKADAFSYCSTCIPDKELAIKSQSDPQYLLSKDSIEVKAVINTTGLLDSHGDVHIDGLWKKSLKEQKLLYHIQEHKMQFDHVISEEVKGQTKIMSWKELGFNYEGDTEALIFNSRIDKARNPFMFEQYAKGYVKNHSVGMRYVNLFLAVNSEDEYFKEEKATWDKYIDQVANKKDAEAIGYFWAVTEAKVIEGSAVLMGSNWATPTQSVKLFEPSPDTQAGDHEPASPLMDSRVSLFEKLANIN